MNNAYITPKRNKNIDTKGTGLKSLRVVDILETEFPKYPTSPRKRHNSEKEEKKNRRSTIET